MWPRLDLGTLTTASTPMVILIILLATLTAVPLLTLLLTTALHRLAIARLPTTPDDSAPTRPPIVPYSLPYLGNALAFLSTKRGHFWESILPILAAHPSLSILTLRLAHQTSHVLYSPPAVTALFKANHHKADRLRFNREVLVKALCMRPEDARKMYWDARDEKKMGGASKERAREVERVSSEIMKRFLLSQDAVSVLTRKFMEVLTEELRADESGEWKEVRLVRWVRGKMLTASATALMGSRLLKSVPDFEDKYWDFDEGFLSRLFAVPRWLEPSSYQSLEVLLPAVEEWVKAGEAHYEGSPPLDVEWEEYLGAKVTRARRKMYKDFNLSTNGMACLDLGFMFGLSSNAIPATLWLLCHLISPSQRPLLNKILAELETAKRPGGHIDVNTLLTAPYLNSSLTETLRVYVDTLVTRELQSDMVICGHDLRKGELVMAPSYLGHHDGAEWSGEGDDAPSEAEWWGERFLKTDEKTGEPGRVFARQEILGAVAVVLLGHEIEFDEWVDTDRMGTVSKRKGSGEAGFPHARKQYTGNGVISMDGDATVRIRRREKW